MAGMQVLQLALADRNLACTMGLWKPDSLEGGRATTKSYCVSIAAVYRNPWNLVNVGGELARDARG
jgi:hypothetical protein